MTNFWPQLFYCCLFLVQQVKFDHRVIADRFLFLHLFPLRSFYIQPPCLDREKLRGQCYDGCSTIMGKKKGVATEIKKDVQPLALFTHCYGHSLNLGCGDWIINSTVLSKSLGTSYKNNKTC